MLAGHCVSLGLFKCVCCVTQCVWIEEDTHTQDIFHSGMSVFVQPGMPALCALLCLSHLGRRPPPRVGVGVSCVYRLMCALSPALSDVAIHQECPPLLPPCLLVCVGRSCHPLPLPAPPLPCGLTQQPCVVCAVLVALLTVMLHCMAVVLVG